MFRASGDLSAGFDILDTNGDGVLNDADDAVSLENGGFDTLIDLGSAFGDASWEGTVLVLGVSDLAAEDFIF